MSLWAFLSLLVSLAFFLAGIWALFRHRHGLHESEERFRQMAETIHEVFWVVEWEAKTLVYLSPAFEDIWGIARQRLGKTPFPWHEYVHPQDNRFISGLSEDLQEREYNVEYRIVRPDGKVRWIRDRAFLARDAEGKIRRIIGIASDITEYKVAYEQGESQRKQLVQADKMKSIGVLAAGIAHEINNPNNYIGLNSDIVRGVWRDAIPILDEYAASHREFSLGGVPYTEARNDITKMVEGIHGGSLRIKRIVKSLKDFAREDLGNLNEAVNVNTAVESAILITENLIKNSTEHFDMRLEALPITIGNLQQLEQVVINLITNACQALTDKTQALEIATSCASDSRTIEICVSDEGCGIHDEDRGRILDPFFTTYRDNGGTGLGLSISYSIIKAHGGSMDFLTGRNGKGTCVVVRLPVRDKLIKDESDATVQRILNSCRG